MGDIEEVRKWNKGHQLLKYGPPYKYDEKDKLILKYLYKDGRMSLADLSKYVKLSRDAIRHRIAKMMSEDVILCFKPIIDTVRLGFPIINYVVISLYNLTPKKEIEFIEWMINNKSITYIASLVGKWDYIIDVITENPGQAGDILKTMRAKFPDIIKEFEVYSVLDEYKYEEFFGLIEGGDKK